MCRRRWLVLVLSVTAAVGGRAQQPVDIDVDGGTLRVRAPGFTFLEGPAWNRLRDGQSVRIALVLTVMSRDTGPYLAERRGNFTMSYDLWEERVAVTHGGPPPRSVSHLTLRAAEAWCLDALAVPRSELAGIARNGRFWVRLESRLGDSEAASASNGDTTSTLGKLIDLLSRTREDAKPVRTVVGGPFRLPE